MQANIGVSAVPYAVTYQESGMNPMIVSSKTDYLQES